MVFTPINKKNTFDAAVNAIGDYIVRNRLQSGDSLIAEPELAEKLGISRNILREALRHYRTLGVLSSKPKVGTVIKSLLPDNPYNGYLPLLASQNEIMPQLAEMRIMLESAGANILTRHATAEDISKLNDICDDFEKTKDNIRKRLETDIKFHSTLLECGHNIFLKGMIPLVVRFFEEQINNPENEYSRTCTAYEDVCREHRMIVKALEEKNSEKLENLLYQHLIKYERYEK